MSRESVRVRPARRSGPSTPAKGASLSRNSPFSDWSLSGRVRHTVVHGEVVVEGREGDEMRPRRREAPLVLADGTVFAGDAIGALETGAINASSGELVFNTAMSGYEEVTTDPSYAGQVIAFTTPHIGNYGTNLTTDSESARPFNRGIVVRELTTVPSNWRSEESLEDFLVRFGIGGLTGVDTRRLTRHIREAGAMPCAFGTLAESELHALAKAEAGDGEARTSSRWSTTTSEYHVNGGPRTVIAYDFGMKKTILRQLSRIATVDVVPASTTAADVLARRPDGVFLSNGPGDPAALGGIVSELAALLGEVPVFGICLGHQLLAAALGGETYKLGFGHHGVNHPVRRLATATVEITSQNHGFAVEPDSVPAAAVTHVQLERRRDRGTLRRTTSTPSRCSTTPKPDPVRTTRRICSASSRRASTRGDPRSGDALMPRRTDISSILVIGSGPIVIGQACEFDYSGTQACRVLVEEGFRVVLANSNPATIMTDPDVADRTYLEPLDHDVLAAIIARERPDALLPTMGGQTALNLAMALQKSGTLEKFDVSLIGASAEAIRTAEDQPGVQDRDDRHRPERSRVEGFRAQSRRGARDRPHRRIPDHRPTELHPGRRREPASPRTSRGCGASQALEHRGEPGGRGCSSKASIAGWKEYELEVMRDHADNCVVVCSIENFDAMGVHTGDSITVAPAQTLTDVEYQAMRDEPFACIRRVGVESGGSNIQFAVNPETGERLRDRDESPRQPLLCARAEGDPGLSDREQDRGPPRRRLTASTQRSRTTSPVPHRRVSSPTHRLRRHQGPPLGL